MITCFVFRYGHIVGCIEISMNKYYVLLTFVHEYIICYVFLPVDAPLLIDGGGVHDQESMSYYIICYVFLPVDVPLLIDGGCVHDQKSILYYIFMNNVNNT